MSGSSTQGPAGMDLYLRLLMEAHSNLTWKEFWRLTSEEKELLTGQIITTYFQFDKRKTIGYYGSYKDMLTAINSNTGSEYDIQEKHLCKSDTQYRELLSYIKRPGHPDIYTILKMPLKEKTALMHTLKQQTSASYVQIMKFLHIPRKESKRQTLWL